MKVFTDVHEAIFEGAAPVKRGQMDSDPREDIYLVATLLWDLDRALHPFPMPDEDEGAFGVEPNVPPPLPESSGNEGGRALRPNTTAPATLLASPREAPRARGLTVAPRERAASPSAAHAPRLSPVSDLARSVAEAPAEARSARAIRTADGEGAAGSIAGGLRREPAVTGAVVASKAVETSDPRTDAPRDRAVDVAPERSASEPRGRVDPPELRAPSPRPRASSSATAPRGSTAKPQGLERPTSLAARSVGASSSTGGRALARRADVQPRAAPKPALSRGASIGDEASKQVDPPRPPLPSLANGGPASIDASALLPARTPGRSAPTSSLRWAARRTIGPIPRESAPRRAPPLLLDPRATEELPRVAPSLPRPPAPRPRPSTDPRDPRRSSVDPASRARVPPRDAPADPSGDASDLELDDPSLAEASMEPDPGPRARIRIGRRTIAIDRAEASRADRALKRSLSDRARWRIR